MRGTKSSWNRTGLMLTVIGLLLSIVASAAVNFEVTDSNFTNPEGTITWDIHGGDFLSYNLTRGLYDEGYAGNHNPNGAISIFNTSTNTSVQTTDTGMLREIGYVYRLIVYNSTGVADTQYSNEVTVPLYFYDGFNSITTDYNDQTSININWDIDRSGTNYGGQTFDAGNLSLIELFRNESRIAIFTPINNSQLSFLDNASGVGLNPGTYDYYLNVTYSNGEVHTSTTSQRTLHGPAVHVRNYTVFDRTQDSVTWYVDFTSNYDIVFTANISANGDYPQTIYDQYCTGKNCSIMFNLTDIGDPEYGDYLELRGFAEKYDDSSIISPEVFVNVTVPNAAPTISSVYLKPAWDTIGRINYTINYSFNDKDGQSPTTIETEWYLLNTTSGLYEWLGVFWNNMTFINQSQNDFVNGETLRARIRVNDSINFSSWVNATSTGGGQQYYETIFNVDSNANVSNTVRVSWEFSEGSGLGNWTPVDGQVAVMTLFRTNETDTTSRDILAYLEQGYYDDTLNIIEETEYNYSIYVRFSNGEETQDSQVGTSTGNKAPELLAGNFSISMDRDRYQNKEIIIVRANVTDKSSVSKKIKATVSGDGLTQNFGPEEDYCTRRLNDVYECVLELGDANSGETLTKGGVLEVTGIEIFEVDNPDFKLTLPDTEKTIINAKPYVDQVAVSKSEYGDQDQLDCSYSFHDKDLADSDGSTNITWFIDNEGLGNFVEILGQKNSYLRQPYFDNGDRVKCKVLGHDGEDYAEEEVNSSTYEYNVNLGPQIYFTNTSTTYENPAVIGGAAELFVKVIDPDNSDPQSIEVLFCRKDIEDYEGTNVDTLTFNESDSSSNELWLFKESLNLPIDEITIKTYNLTDDTGNYVNFSDPAYSIHIYEADYYNQTNVTSDDLILRDEANIMINDYPNKFKFDSKKTTKEYYSIKICVDADKNEVCDTPGSSLRSFDIKANLVVDASEKKYFSLGTREFLSKEITINHDIIGDNSDCGELTLDDGAWTGGEDLYSASIIVPDSLTQSNQTYTVFATDSNDVRVSATGTIFVNHPPQIEGEGVTLYSRESIAGTTWKNVSDTVNSNETISCNFTITDTDTNPAWNAEILNYSVSWLFKEVGSDTWEICGSNRGCAGSASIYLPYAITQAGDTWKCEVTPKDKFIDGEAVESAEMTILDNAEVNQTLGKPFNLIISDESETIEELKYTGKNLSMTLEWEDEDSSRFSIYVCYGGAQVTQSGCLWNSLYREPIYDGQIGYNQRNIQWTIPENVDLTGNNFTYTAHIYDETGLHNQIVDEVFAIDLKNISIKVIDYYGTEFTDDEAQLSDSLLCNFSFREDGINFSNDNISYLIQNEKIELNWNNNGFIAPGFKNSEAIAYSNTLEGDSWSCQIEFMRTPDDKIEESINQVSIVNTSDVIYSSPVLMDVRGPIETLSGTPIDYEIDWTDSDGEGVKIFVCNTTEIELSGCIDGEMSRTFDFVDVNTTLQYMPAEGETDVEAHIAVFDEKGLKSNNLSVKTTIVPDFRIELESVETEVQNTVNVTGILVSDVESVVGNKTINIFSYKDPDFLDLYPLSASVNTTEYNPQVKEFTIKQTINANESIIYLEKGVEGINDSMYIGFDSHTREGYKYYKVNSVNGENNTLYTIVNLTENVEFGALVDSSIWTYNSEYVSGRFEKEISLYKDMNYILFEINRYTQELGESVFKDSTDPSISILNHTLIQGEGDLVKITLEDNYKLNLDSLRINFTNGSEYDIYNFTNGTLTPEISNLSMLNLVTINSTGLNKTEIAFSTEDLRTGSYSLNIFVEDNMENNYTNNATYYFEEEKLEVLELRIKDNVTESYDVLNTFDVLVDWAIDNDSKLKSANYQLFEDKEVIASGTVNSTDPIYINQALKNGSTYYVKLSATTLWNVVSEIYRSPDVTYLKKPVEITNIQYYDKLTGNTEEVRSNEIKLEWDINAENNKLLDSFDVYIMKEETLLDFVSTNETFAEFELELMEEGDVYEAYVTTKSIAGVNKQYSIGSLTYDSDDSLVLKVSSEYFMNNQTIAYNDLINFTINVVNGNEWDYEIIDPVTQAVVRNGSNVFDSVYDSQIINESRVSPSNTLEKTLYKLSISATSNYGYGTETQNFTLARDVLDPEVFNATGVELNYYNNQTINITFNVSDENGVKEAKVYIDNEEYSLEIIEEGYLPNDDEYKTIRAAINGSKFYSKEILNITLVAIDFAGNSDNESYLINITNRAPVNITNLPNIYWNKYDATINSIELSDYFGGYDLDGDLIFYNLSYPSNGADLYVGTGTGTLSGRVRTSSDSEFNITINVSDKFNMSNEYNITIYVANLSCSSYQGLGVLVGFGSSCALTDPGTDSGTNPVYSGSSGGGGGSSRGRNTGTPKIVVQDRYIELMYDLEKGQVKEIDIEKQDVSIKQIRFEPTKDVRYARVMVQKLLSLPEGTTQIDDIYQFLQIENKEMQEKFDVAKLTFAIPINNPQRINQNNAAAYRWYGGEWVRYDLEFTHEEAGKYYYEVTIPGFSYWAIGRQKDGTTNQIVQQPEPTEPEVEQPRPSKPIFGGDEEPETEPETSSNMGDYLLYGGLVLVAVGFIAGGLVINKRNSQKLVMKEPETISTTATTTENQVIKLDPLPEYIKRQQEKGVAKEEIISILLNTGWSQQEIDTAFTQLEHEPKKINMSLVNNQLVMQIQSLMDRGSTKKEIQEELRLQHIQEDIIQSNVNYTQALNKLEDQIKDWVEDGYTLDEIKSYLLQMSWPVMTIYEILKKFKQ